MSGANQMRGGSLRCQPTQKGQAKVIKRSQSSSLPATEARKKMELQCVKLVERMFDDRMVAVFELFHRRQNRTLNNIFNTFSLETGRRFSAPPRMFSDLKNPIGVVSTRQTGGGKSVMAVLMATFIVLLPMSVAVLAVFVAGMKELLPKFFKI
ncbi:hypothetical protein PFISCL1PPCAC_17322 [Pristionchus fissidentatus]|uniref:Uncharacterized protein n=1 Tax=Pristionchus fissidentatus TaxID=1538716 RepID=A0AAV5W6L9_9BILA|nr:hypothetical protein PFISCL1PPCAC_17322 [Pristionchus fissidentatus]